MFCRPWNVAFQFYFLTFCGWLNRALQLSVNKRFQMDKVAQIAAESLLMFHSGALTEMCPPQVDSALKYFLIHCTFSDSTHPNLKRRFHFSSLPITFPFISLPTYTFSEKREAPRNRYERRWVQWLNHRFSRNNSREVEKLGGEIKRRNQVEMRKKGNEETRWEKIAAVFSLCVLTSPGYEYWSWILLASLSGWLETLGSSLSISCGEVKTVLRHDKWTG